MPEITKINSIWNVYCTLHSSKNKLLSKGLCINILGKGVLQLEGYLSGHKLDVVGQVCWT